MTNKKLELNGISIVIVVLLVLNLVVSVVTMITSISAKNSSLWIEELKVGGKENFKLLEEYFNSDSYKSQQKTAIQNALNQAKGQQPAADANTQQPQANVQQPAETKEQTIPADVILKRIAEIKKDAQTLGNPNARYTVLEYSELLCPFCRRHNNDGTLKQLLEKYPNDVNHIHRHFIVHPEATQFAVAMECAAEQKGTPGYYQFIEEAFKPERVTTAILSGIVTTMNLDVTKFNSCLTSNKYSQKINAQTEEGRSLGVDGTPGNILIDTKTGKYIPLVGAYPFDRFDTAMQTLMKE